MKKFKVIILSLIMIFAFAGLSVNAAETVASGECGDNLTWVLDDSGTLTISGTGAMTDYTTTSPRSPWYHYRSYISDIKINNGLTSIGNLAFYGCSVYNNITIPESVTSIGDNAFRLCGLTSITILSESTVFGTNVFWGVSDPVIKGYDGSPVQTYANDNGYTFIPIAGKCGDNVTWMFNNGTLTISGTYGMYCEMYDYDEYIAPWCSYAEDVTSIVIGDNVSSIGSHAFWCCNLTEIIIPGNIDMIGDYAFEDCSSLKSVTILSNPMFGISIFSNTSSLLVIKSYYNSAAQNYANDNGHAFKILSGECGDSLTWTLDYGTLIISGTGAMDAYSTAPWYQYRNYIQQIVIDNAVASIGNQAFKDCTNLIDITFGNNVSTIGHYAFENCSNLTSITIPNSVTTIGIGAFSDCSGLLTITIPDSVTTIGYNAFSHCVSLHRITIPDSITAIDDWTFYDCSGLTTITIPDSVTTIGDVAFCGCSNLMTITIPDSVTTIKDGTFGDCSRLKSVMLGKGITSIGSSAFENCSSLKSVTIPSNVTLIDNYAFNSCTSLSNIIVLSKNTILGNNILSDTSSSLVIKSYDDSTAQMYANDNGHTFEVITDAGEEIIAEISDALTNYISDDSKATCFTTEITNLDNTSEVVQNVTWIITPEDGTGVEIPVKLPTAVTLENTASAVIGIVLDGLYDANATAKLSI